MPHLALYTFGVLKAPLADPSPPAREFSAGTRATSLMLGRRTVIGSHTWR